MCPIARKASSIDIRYFQGNLLDFKSFESAYKIISDICKIYGVV